MNFKKLTALILVLIMAVIALASCGMVEFYHEDIGLTISLPEDFERSEYGAKDVITYENIKGNAAVVINSYTYEDVRSSKFGRDFSLQEYVNLSLEELGLGESIAPTYPSETRAVFEVAAGEYENETPQYSYNLVIMEGGRIYVVQMICLATDMENYHPKFEKWARNIEIG